MMKATVLAALLAATGAQAQQGLVLPTQGGLHLWDMAADPARRLTGPLPRTAKAGACYALTDDRLVPQDASCLDYYVLDSAGDHGPMQARGRMAFNDTDPDPAHRGLQLSDAKGVEDCGERDNCDVVYIAGFADAELAAKAMQLARDGADVMLTGQGVWNMESVDMIVQSVAAN